MVISSTFVRSFLVAALSTFIFAQISFALDNPDAPDLLGEFKTRAQSYEAEIQSEAQTTKDYAEAYQKYEIFLDNELNKSYRALTAELSADQTDSLQQSQRAWLKYRDKEFEFIAKNWTVENFGSSSTISRGDYRTSLLKERVITLLSYLKNY